MGGQHHAPAALPPRKTRYLLYRRLGGPQGRYGRLRKISPPPGFDPRTVQPVASRYTDWATRLTFDPRTVQPVVSRCTDWATRPTKLIQICIYVCVCIYIYIYIYLIPRNIRKNIQCSLFIHSLSKSCLKLNSRTYFTLRKTNTDL
jgi:hypothetical protein